MRRKPLGEPADRQKVKALLKKNHPGWMQTRLSALKMGFNDENSKAFIAESPGVSERSLTRWFTAFGKDNLDAVLERGYGIGRPSDMDKDVEAYQLKGLENARWNTAEQAREELSKHFERNFKCTTARNRTSPGSGH
jgi:transposase